MTGKSGEILDKNGEEIKEGDTVYTKFRGGKREGEVTTLHSAFFSC
jgi:transcription elongation factor